MLNHSFYKNNCSSTKFGEVTIMIEMKKLKADVISLINFLRSRISSDFLFVSKNSLTSYNISIHWS